MHPYILRVGVVYRPSAVCLTSLATVGSSYWHKNVYDHAHWPIEALAILLESSFLDSAIALEF